MITINGRTYDRASMRVEFAGHAIALDRIDYQETRCAGDELVFCQFDGLSGDATFRRKVFSDDQFDEPDRRLREYGCALDINRSANRRHRLAAASLARRRARR